MKFKAYGVIAVSLVAIFVSAVYSNAASALYTRAQIDDRLQNGLNTALRWDISDSGNGCREVTRLAVNNNATISTLRNSYMNTTYAGYPPASYKDSSWLSKYNSPNTTNPVMVNYGATNLDLQINFVNFLCGTLVNPDVGTNCTSTRASTMYDDNRWVTTSRVDRVPNRAGNQCLRPALTGTHTRIVGITINSTGAFGGTTNFSPGSTLYTDRDDNSRYWFADPVRFRYFFNSPIVSSGRIQLTLHTKNIRAYSGGVHRCNLTSGGSMTVSGRSDFRSVCRTYNNQVSLDIQPTSTYQLNPAVSVNTGGGVVDGQRYSVSGSVNNTGETASTDTRWQITKMVYAPGDTPSTASARSNNSVPCSNFGGYRSGSCETFNSGTRGFAIGNTSPIGSDQETADQPAGSSVCYATSVNTPTPASRPSWRHSALECVVIGKKPLITITGGDMKIGSFVDTSSKSKDGRQYGSWVEYAAFITDRNKGNRFGSGSSLANGGSGLTRDGGEFTFANRGALGSGSHGWYGPLGTPNTTLATAMSSLAIGNGGSLSGGVNLSNLSSGRYVASGDLSLRGTIPAGRTIIIDARNYRIGISDNISYSSGSYSSIDRLPQVVLIADRINIHERVDRIDAWLLASRSGGEALVDTCSNRSMVSISTCDDLLTVNGPVASDDANFKRTSGSDEDGSTADPAENLNLRADAYLWLYAQSKKSVTPLTVKVTELPPRY